ncbi:hypothetical protein [Thermococcus celer]|uniref:hypothetical protein n=1 Tax=Thermococcus celer TaxID=2264 RepID=UPI001F20D655|nr:hypothetical protein [Thermococcus celer]
MTVVWNISTVGIPFMDMSPDGSLSAVIDWNNHIVYLVKPDGTAVSFDVQGNDDVEPVISGVVVKDGRVYVLGSYEAFSGVRVYSWNGQVGELEHGGSGSVADGMRRSPDGKHLCYLVSVSPTEQVLRCDWGETKLTPNDYDINWVSNTGLVVLTEGGKSFVLKDGENLATLNTPNVIAYGDRLIASEDGTLKILAPNGTVLATRENAGFSQTTLLRWTLLPTGRYIFRHEPLEDTHVFTWNLSEVKTLPGFPYFANENFVVTAKDGVIHCYSLRDFHEVFSVKVPGDSLGYVRLSDDGKVMLISGETGDFWLYVAK